MRASGSHSVTLRRASSCRRPRCAAASRSATRVAYMESNLTAGLFHASASLGIAETAHASVAAGLGGARRSSTAAGAMLAAESAIELVRLPRGRSPARRRSIDDHYAAQPDVDGDREELTALFAEAQAAKTFVNEAARTGRRPGARALRRRRLPERQPARPRLPRRPRRRLHAPAGREPRLRLRRQVALGGEPRSTKGGQTPLRTPRAAYSHSQARASALITMPPPWSSSPASSPRGPSTSGTTSARS